MTVYFRLVGQIIPVNGLFVQYAQRRYVPESYTNAVFKLTEYNYTERQREKERKRVREN